MMRNEGVCELARKKCLAEARHLLGKSAYRVERCFDAMDPEDKAIIFAFANIEANDLVEPYKNPSRLRHFTESGQRKIAKAYRRIRQLATTLPQGISLSEFHQIDREIT